MYFCERFLNIKPYEKFIFSVVFSFVTAFGFAQYDVIEPFGMYQEHWAEVEKNGKFGYIDTDGKKAVIPL